MLVPWTPGRRSFTPASAVCIEPEASNLVTEAAVYSPPTTTGSPSPALTTPGPAAAEMIEPAAAPAAPTRIARRERGMVESIAIADTLRPSKARLALAVSVGQASTEIL